MAASLSCVAFFCAPSVTSQDGYKWAMDFRWGICCLFMEYGVALPKVALRALMDGKSDMVAVLSG